MTRLKIVSRRAADGPLTVADVEAVPPPSGVTSPNPARRDTSLANTNKGNQP